MFYQSEGVPPPERLIFSCARWHELSFFFRFLLLLLLLPTGGAGSFQQEYIVERPSWGGPGGPSGLAWLGLAWLGGPAAWLGLAWLGLAWLGLATQKIFSALRAKV